MILNRLLLKSGEKQHFSEDVDFAYFEGDENHCKKINSCHIEMDALEIESLLLVNIKGTAEVVASCKYTLEDVPLIVKFQEDFPFTNDEEDTSSYYEKGNEIDLNPYILALILDKVPHTAVKEGAARPKDGNGYRVLTEDELEKERSHKVDSRWSKLDEIEIK